MILNKKKIVITTSVALVIVVTAMAVGALLGSHNPTKQISYNVDNMHVNTPKRRFFLPDGYKKVEVDGSNFAEFLRHLPLKPYCACLHSWEDAFNKWFKIDRKEETFKTSGWYLTGQYAKRLDKTKNIIIL